MADAGTDLAEYVKQVYDDAKKALSGEKIDASTMLSLTVRLMELVEKLPSLSGPEKKQVVIEVVKLLIDETDLTDEENAKVDIIIDTTLPLAIDVIISASRGALSLNGLKNRLRKLKCC